MPILHWEDMHTNIKIPNSKLSKLKVCLHKAVKSWDQHPVGTSKLISQRCTAKAGERYKYTTIRCTDVGAVSH